MPPSLGGKRFDRKRHNNSIKDDAPFPWAQDCQLYAKVEAALGNSRMKVLCSDLVERTATVRGSMHKRTWIDPQDIVLVSLRQLSTNSSTVDRVDIIFKYSPVQTRHLRRAGVLRELEEVVEEDDSVVFDDKDDVDVDMI